MYKYIPCQAEIHHFVQRHPEHHPFHYHGLHHVHSGKRIHNRVLHEPPVKNLKIVKQKYFKLHFFFREIKE